MAQQGTARGKKGDAARKSYETDEPRVKYCTELSVRFHPAQTKLHAATMGLGRRAGMMGAPEVLQMGSNLIQLIGGKRVLDIGESPIYHAHSGSI